MGNLIKWKAIDTEATYDQARVYRSDLEDGTYTYIAYQSITDQSYYDADGTTASWYKIDFYNSSTSQVSALSDAIQGGTYRSYCTPEDIRNMTNLTSSDLTDTQLFNLIQYCGNQLNHDINVYIEEEDLIWISNTKKNEVNGSNTTFYTRNYPIGDSNNDMDVTIADIDVYSYDSDGTKTELTVSSITPNTGKFVLESAPDSGLIKVTVTYRYAPLSVSDPHQLIKMACSLLTAAWAYTKINVGKAPRWRMGSTAIWRDMDSFKTYYNNYLKILTQINDRSLVNKRDSDNVM